MTVEAIVGAAIDTIDDVGAEAFSFRVLASRLGVYPTAISHHVGDRRRLLGLVGSAWIREAIPTPDLADPVSWLETMGHSYRRAAQRHPNVARLAARELVTDGDDFGLPEVVISHLAAAGLPDDELSLMYNTLIGSIVGFVDLELVEVPQSPAADPVDEAQYPTLHQHFDLLANRAFSLRSQPGEAVPMDDSFSYLMDMLLAGVRERATPVAVAR